MIKGARIVISHALNESLAPRAVNKKCEITYGRINSGPLAVRSLGKQDNVPPFGRSPVYAGNAEDTSRKFYWTFGADLTKSLHTLPLGPQGSPQKGPRFVDERGLDFLAPS